MFKRKKEIRYLIPSMYVDKTISEECMTALAHVINQDVYVEVYDGDKKIADGNIHEFFRTPHEESGGMIDKLKDKFNNWKS